MNAAMESVARACLQGAYADTLTFPEIVARLSDAGFDGYVVDLRRAVTTFYLPDGDSVVLDASRPALAVSERFDAARIREAQTSAPGYTYKGFCYTAARAGCAGYLVSLPGRRVLYYGRTGEVHTEYFPGGDKQLPCVTAAVVCLKAGRIVRSPLSASTHADRGSARSESFVATRWSTSISSGVCCDCDGSLQ